MNKEKFRAELKKVMPGYKWTVHYTASPDPDGSFLTATGTQSAGYNRISTLRVTRTEKDGIVEYEAKSAGFGKRAPWLDTATDSTLARALRALQEHYETMATLYGKHAMDLAAGRREF